MRATVIVLGDIFFILIELQQNQIGINLLYTGRLFHCCMLDKSTCHFRDATSIL